MQAMQPLSSVDLGPLEQAYVREALESGWISSVGPFVERFESAVAQRIDRAHVVSTSSGSAALELVLRALEVGPGDEVIVPALTFAAPANAVISVGAVPRFVDVSSDTWTLDPRAAEDAIGPRTRLIIAVDLLGHPCDFEALGALGVPILEDAAQAHGAALRGQPVGSFGVASVFSFHASKAISTGEGGCVATDDAALARRLRVSNGHGMHRARPYRHVEPGHNYRMTNVAAAIGCAQLERWSELTEARRRVQRRYEAVLRDAPVEHRPAGDSVSPSTWVHAIGVDRRDEVLAACRAAEIDARAIWPILPRQPAFASAGHWPVAAGLADRVALLPTHARMGDDDVDRVAETIRWALGEPHDRRVTRRVG